MLCVHAHVCMCVCARAHACVCALGLHCVCVSVVCEIGRDRMIMGSVLIKFILNASALCSVEESHKQIFTIIINRSTLNSKASCYMDPDGPSE